MQAFEHIAITGASSGIGRALALHYAKIGVTLSLHGRNIERLDAVATAARAKGAEVFTHAGDITDAQDLGQWLCARDGEKAVDLLIANAGISAGSGIFGETLAQASKVFEVNVQGVMNTVLPLIPIMVARKRGQIGIMSSLAGMRGLPSAPAYSASKAAVKAYGEALRGYLGKHGVGVSVLIPGYVKTPLTAENPFPMPGILKPERAAIILAAGLARNRARVVFPLWFYLATWFASCLSPTLTDPVFARLPAKPEGLG